MNYYKVEAKCGHVGRNKYIKKFFYVKCKSGKQAALIVRNTSRVKHHHKDAIINVIKITLIEYENGLKIFNEDNYFKAHSIQEQRLNCDIGLNDLFDEEEKIEYKTKHNGQNIKNIILEMESMKQLREAKYYE